MTAHRANAITQKISMARLMEIFRNPNRHSCDEWLAAMTEVCRRKGIKPPTLFEIADEVWRTPHLPVGLRFRAAWAVLPFYPSVDNAPTNKGG